MPAAMPTATRTPAACVTLDLAFVAGDPHLTTTAVVVPIRSFDGALSRLATVLGATARKLLMRLMAEQVVAAAQGLPVYVATDDAEVAAWASQVGASTLRAGRPGLTTAVTSAVQYLTGNGTERVVIAHADLALARTLLGAVGPGLTIVPDRHRDGSNVVCVPTGRGFRFSYGPHSFERHVTEAQRLGLPVTVVDDLELATDIDHPVDLGCLPERLLRRLPESLHNDLRGAVVTASR